MKFRHTKILSICCLLVASSILLQACSAEPQNNGDKNIGISNESGYSSIFDHDSVMDISITIDNKDWQEILNSPEDKAYHSCTVNINGKEFKEVGLRTKGNSTLKSVSKSESNRYSFKIEFDHYHKETLLNGLDKLILNNIYDDPSYVLEYMAYYMNEYMGVITPYFSFACITINGDPWGLYLAIEGIEESFTERTENTDSQIYKPENSTVNVIDKFSPPETSSDIRKHDFDGGADLVYRDDSAESYPNIFDNAVFKPDETAKKRLIDAIKGLNKEEDKEAYVNVEECTAYLATLTFTNNPDSYYSPYVCNYYLMEKDGKLSMIPWDLNRSFCGFTRSESVYYISAPINDPWDVLLGFMIGHGSKRTQKPLFESLCLNEKYKDNYYSNLTKLSQWVMSDSFKKLYDDTVDMISPYIEKDTTCFYDLKDIKPTQQRLFQYITLRAKCVMDQIVGTIPPDSAGRGTMDPSKLNPYHIS